MTIDPAFGAAVAFPIILLAIGCAYAACTRPRELALIVIGALIGFVAGCVGPLHERQGAITTAPPNGGRLSPTNSTGAPSRPAALQVPALSQRERKLALSKLSAGRVAVDVVDDHVDSRRTNPSLEMDRRGTLYVNGWAYVIGKNRPCAKVVLTVDSRGVYSGRYGYPRPDVAAYYSNQDVLNVGYRLDVPAAKIGKGKHTGQIVCLDGAGGATATEKRLALTVR